MLIFDLAANNYIQARRSPGGGTVEVLINDPYTDGSAIDLTDDQVDSLIAQLQAAKKERV